MSAVVEKKANARKFNNVIVDTPGQLRLSIPFFFMIIVNCLIIGLVQWQISKMVFVMTSPPSDEAIDASYVVAQGLRQILQIEIAGLILLGFLSSIFWLTCSHRIFGPTVAIHRHLDRLIRGDYEVKIHLRKNDEFKSIANKLNVLTKTLKEKARP